MQVLQVLIERRGQLVAAQELLDEVWPANHVSGNTVYKAINELREAFGDSARSHQYIETKSRKGYRLIAEVGASTPEFSNLVSRTSLVRSLAVMTSLALALLVLFAVLSPDRISTQINIVSIDGQRIALIPPKVENQSQVLGFVELIFKELSTKIAQLQNASMESTEVSDVDNKTLTADLDLDHVVRLDHSGAYLIVDITAITNKLSLMDRFDVFAPELSGATTADRMKTVDERLQDSTLTISIANDLPSDLDSLETAEADHFAIVNDIVSHIIADLEVLLSEEDRERMQDWGTSSVHAYRYAREGDTHQRNSTVDSLTHAAELFRKSVDEDSKFSYGYESLSAVFHDLAMLSSDTASRERVRQDLRELYREVSLVLPESEAARSIERQYRFQSIASAFDAEAYWRSELIADPMNMYALRRYADLLVGAKLTSESELYLQKAISVAPEEALDWLEMDYATIEQARGNQAAAVRRMKLNIDRFPDFTLSLFGLVRTQARLGNFAEAESYLTQLTASDAVWGYTAQLYLQAFRGDLERGSKALQAAFDNPMANNTTRGSISFVLGDVPGGIAYWRMIEPGFLRLLWQFHSSQEWLWAPGVVEDPRYQSLLNELGIGENWRRYMRTQAKELSATTGINVETPFVSK